MKLMTFSGPLAGADDAAHDAPAASVANWLSAKVGDWRQRAGDRALRRELAELDTALLRDIGIAEDEIWRIRSRERFTPRHWR